MLEEQQIAWRQHAWRKLACRLGLVDGAARQSKSRLAIGVGHQSAAIETARRHAARPIRLSGHRQGLSHHLQSPGRQIGELPWGRQGFRHGRVNRRTSTQCQQQPKQGHAPAAPW